MLSPCWGIPDVTLWFLWLQLCDWFCPSVPVSCVDLLRIPSGEGGEFSLVTLEKLKSTVYESVPHTIQELKDNNSHAVAAISITMLPRYTSTWLDVRSCVLMQEATTCNIFCDGISFQHLATLLISVFMLCYGPGLLFRGPPCFKVSVVFYVN